MNAATIHWHRLRALLDMMFGFTNRTRSTIKKASQTFDDRTQEHVILIEYRARVTPAITPKWPSNPQEKQRASMASIRELLATQRKEKRGK